MKIRAAGFIISKIFPDGSIKYLGLVASIEKRVEKGGVYDIPKGKIEDGESSLECAKRECEEECGIVIEDSDILGAPYCEDGLCLYFALTRQSPEIKANPVTGIFEHEGFAWLKKDEIINGALCNLKKYISCTIDQF